MKCWCIFVCKAVGQAFDDPRQISVTSFHFNIWRHQKMIRGWKGQSAAWGTQFFQTHLMGQDWVPQNQMAQTKSYQWLSAGSKIIPQKPALCFFGYRAMSQYLVVFRGNFCTGEVCFGTSTPRRKMSLQTLAESSRVITPPGASTAKNWPLKGVNHV